MNFVVMSLGLGFVPQKADYSLQSLRIPLALPLSAVPVNHAVSKSGLLDGQRDHFPRGFPFYGFHKFVDAAVFRDHAGLLFCMAAQLTEIAE